VIYAVPTIVRVAKYMRLICVICNSNRELKNSGRKSGHFKDRECPERVTLRWLLERDKLGWNRGAFVLELSNRLFILLGN
jgi:hypothetical protein